MVFSECCFFSLSVRWQEIKRPRETLEERRCGVGVKSDKRRSQLCKKSKSNPVRHVRRVRPLPPQSARICTIQQVNKKDDTTPLLCTSLDPVFFLLQVERRDRSESKWLQPSPNPRLNWPRSPKITSPSLSHACFLYVRETSYDWTSRG